MIIMISKHKNPQSRQGGQRLQMDSDGGDRWVRNKSCVWTVRKNCYWTSSCDGDDGDYNNNDHNDDDDDGDGDGDGDGDVLLVETSN